MNLESDKNAEYQRLWERYMEVEHQELEDRRNDELAKVLGPALPGESQEEMDRLVREDRETAEQGLVWLQEGDRIWNKHIDELTREDRPARIESQRRRLEWVQGRLRPSDVSDVSGAHAEPAQTGGGAEEDEPRKER